MRLIPKTARRLCGAPCLLLMAAVLPAQGENLGPRLQALLGLLPPQEEIPVLVYAADLPADSLRAAVPKGRERIWVKEARSFIQNKGLRDLQIQEASL